MKGKLAVAFLVGVLATVTAAGVAVLAEQWRYGRAMARVRRWR